MKPFEMLVWYETSSRITYRFLIKVCNRISWIIICYSQNKALCNSWNDQQYFCLAKALPLLVKRCHGLSNEKGFVRNKFGSSLWMNYFNWQSQIEIHYYLQYQNFGKSKLWISFSILHLESLMTSGLEIWKKSHALIQIKIVRFQDLKDIFSTQKAMVFAPIT